MVETDPTAFYSYDEYDEAAKMLYKTVMLRAESIIGQLDGTIPSTDDGQKQDSSALIDASEIDTDVMGQFSMGMGKGDGKDDDDSGESQLNNAVKRPKREREAEKEAEKAKEKGGQMPGGFNPMGQDSSGTNLKVLAEYGIYLAIITAALLIVSKTGARKRFIKPGR